MIGLDIIELESAWLLKEDEETVSSVLIAPSSWGILLERCLDRGPVLPRRDEEREGWEEKLKEFWVMQVNKKWFPYD